MLLIGKVKKIEIDKDYVHINNNTYKRGSIDKCSIEEKNESIICEIGITLTVIGGILYFMNIINMYILIIPILMIFHKNTYYHIYVNGIVPIYKDKDKNKVIEVRNALINKE